MGSRESVPDEQMVQNAISSTQKLWDSDNLLVILRDDHFRICAASKAMKNLFHVDEKIWKEKFYLRNIISVMLDADLFF